MGEIGAYQQEDKKKNYLLPTGYHEKEWTLQEHIYLKLKKVSELIDNLYPKLAIEHTGNIKFILEKNLETLIDDLELLRRCLDKAPSSFNTSRLNTNQHCIDEMKNACDELQMVKAFEQEFKTLGQIKHALSELEHLIQPSKFEKSLIEAAKEIKARDKSVKKVGLSSAKKAKTASAKKAKPAKAKAPAAAPKKAAKKVTKPKAKAAPKAKPKAKAKAAPKAKAKPKVKAKAAPKTKAKPKAKVKAKASPKPKVKAKAKPKAKTPTKAKPKAKASASKKKK